MKISGNIVDVRNRRIFSGTINIKDTKIVSIEENKETYSEYCIQA